MRKATWVVRWMPEHSVTRSVGLNSEYRISAELDLTYPQSESARPFRLDLTADEAKYLAHRLLFHVEMFEKRDAAIAAQKETDNA